MIECVIATKRRTCDEPLATKQKTNITSELFPKIPPQTEGDFFNPKSVRKGAFFIPETKGRKNDNTKIHPPRRNRSPRKLANQKKKSPAERTGKAASQNLPQKPGQEPAGPLPRIPTKRTGSLSKIGETEWPPLNTNERRKKMNNQNIIRNTVLTKLGGAAQRGSLTEIRRPDIHHTLETEYRITRTENGGTLYRITRTYKEHCDYIICGAGPSFRYSNRTNIWEQEDGQGTTKYRYIDTISRRRTTDPNEPWETETLSIREVTDPTDLPTTNLPVAEGPSCDLNRERDCHPREAEEEGHDYWSRLLREAEERKARLILRAHHAGQEKRQEKEAEYTR